MKSTWQTKRLVDVCEFRRGLTYSKRDEVSFSHNAVLRANNINLETNSIDLKDIKFIRDDISVPIEKKVKKHSLLICTASGSINHLGKVALITKDLDYAFGGFMGLISPKMIIDYKYLYYFFISDSYRYFINELSSGININNLSFDKLKDLEITFPEEILEQKRIVKVLDEAFEKIEKAKLYAENDIHHSKELSRSYLNHLTSSDPNGWVTSNLFDLTTKIGSGATPKGGHNSYKSSGISLIRSLNVHDEGFHYQKLAYIDQKQADQLENVIVNENDILINITGASIARSTIVPLDTLPARVNQHVSIIRCKPNLLLPKFLHLILISKIYKDRLLIKGEKNGATRQALTKDILQKLEITYPLDLLEQQDVVNRFVTFAQETKKLHSVFQKKLENFEQLKKSILQKAFAGEL